VGRPDFFAKKRDVTREAFVTGVARDEPHISEGENMGITAETKPENLEARVAKLEAGKKDWWDKFQIVGTLLIPASITIAGYLYSQAMSKAGMDSAQRAADQQNATARS
jgi:hypothetical protein